MIPPPLYVLEITRPGSWRDSYRRDALGHLAEVSTALQVERTPGTQLRARVFHGPRVRDLGVAVFDGHRWIYGASHPARRPS